MIKAFIIRLINGKWYSAPLIFTIFTVFCWLCLIVFPTRALLWGFLISLPFLGYFICFMLGIAKIFMKEFKEGIKQCFFTVVISIIAMLFFTVFLPVDPYREYKGDAKNPNNVKTEMPLKLSLNEEKSLFKVDKQDILLYDYSMPGNYKYQVFLNKIEKGKVYLKMFDLVTNRILSEKDIKKSSQIEVYNPTDELKEFGLSNPITVEEGEWGDYYGSRVEVWFQPDDSTQPERKLITKNYIIQGQ